MKIVHIRWNDAYGVEPSSEWSTAEEVTMRPLILDEVGLLVKEDEDQIAIASEYSEDSKSFRGITLIPKMNIISRKEFDI